MELAVTLTTDAAGLVHASTAALPVIHAVGANREQALAEFRRAVEAMLAAGNVALIDIPASPPSPNPWIELAGSFAADPDLLDIMNEAYARHDTALWHKDR